MGTDKNSNKIEFARPLMQPCDTKLPILNRDPFETIPEFRQRLEDSLWLIGTTKLDPSSYDIESGIFPVQIDWLEWATHVSPIPQGTYIPVTRDIARLLTASGSTFEVRAILRVDDQWRISIRAIQLRTPPGLLDLKDKFILTKSPGSGPFSARYRNSEINNSAIFITGCGVFVATLGLIIRFIGVVHEIITTNNTESVNWHIDALISLLVIALISGFSLAYFVNREGKLSKICSDEWKRMKKLDAELEKRKTREI